MDREAELRELDLLAARMWAAAEAIDALRGGDRAWRWTGQQVARLNEQGHIDVSGESKRVNLPAVEEVVATLEERLEMERDGRRGVEA